METPVGVWCGYREKMEASNSIIKYEKITISASNMGNNNKAGLDAQSGKNFIGNPEYQFPIKSMRSSFFLILKKLRNIVTVF